MVRRACVRGVRPLRFIGIDDFRETLRRRLNECQQADVVITRRGRPAAVLFGVEGMDWERFILRTDDSFWRMLQRRRRKKATPLSKARRRLGIQ